MSWPGEFLAPSVSPPPVSLRNNPLQPAVRRSNLEFRRLADEMGGRDNVKMLAFGESSMSDAKVPDAEQCHKKSRFRRSRWYELTCNVTLAAVVINLIAFVVHAASVGGFTWNGSRDSGRFLIRDKGRVTEVTEQQWRWMRRHEVLLVMTLPIGLVAGIASMESAKARRRDQNRRSRGNSL